VLKEAKDLLPHGGWGKWLEESVSYSQITADRLMRIYSAYGSNQPSLPESDAQAQELPNLTSSQALILLGLPPEDRAQFLVEMDAEGLSTRALKKAVDDWKLARQDKDRAFEERDQALQEKEDVRQKLDDEKGKNVELTAERDKLKAETNHLKQTKQKLEQEIENGKAAYDKLKERIGYKNIEKMSAGLTEAHNKAEANKIAFLYDTLNKTFKELAYEMTRFAAKNPDAHAMYQEKVRDFLLKSIKEKL
jgi:DNA repair exonuclease SbcCD ATPase subunit